MASTPTPQPPPPPIPIKVAARKLPVKRKAPETPSPFPNPNPHLSPKLEAADDDDDVDGEDIEAEDDLRPPPFKFHRIWPESDEIRFLQGLLDCSADGLTFPRDLHLFYDRFSQSMPQPYTKSQLSEKLRRLRKKFRVISARIARGLDASLLTPHDRALFDLSKQLWHPAFASSSPFLSNNKRKPPAKVRVTATLSPTPLAALPPPSSANVNDADNEEDDDIETNGVNLETHSAGGHEDEPELPGSAVTGSTSRGGLGRHAGKTILDVFDRSLKEVRMVLVRQGLLYPDDRTTPADSSKQDKAAHLTKRWREQRASELDVLARRLRLVLEHAIRQQ
ncbi:PREDICTED: probable transcription factor At5g28040 [Nelumbo nucifera]|uniref:Probable transcription factor At5g28040 n=1 Tax=Nelumbo nucifera TaxID=4432 RepID=A0A1U8BED4_NELNU|nr:PREDICTED: probable transcription factor At5g28040 [Nelumbo nucifera]